MGNVVDLWTVRRHNEAGEGCGLRLVHFISQLWYDRPSHSLPLASGFSSAFDPLPFPPPLFCFVFLNTFYFWFQFLCLFLIWSAILRNLHNVYSACVRACVRVCVCVCVCVCVIISKDIHTHNSHVCLLLYFARKNVQVALKRENIIA